MAGRDLSGAPASRYRVVERGRRLVVIDTRTGQDVAPAAGRDGHAPAVAAFEDLSRAVLPLQIAQTRFDGSGELRTHPAYDAHGPRTIRLDAGSAAIVNWVRIALIGTGVGAVLLLVFAPALLLVPAVALSNTRVRAWLRRTATDWLNTVAREVG